MAKPKQKQKKTGVLKPDTIYTTAALGRAGIGSMLLMEARRNGVRPHIVGNNLWYEGCDIIDWIKTKPRKDIGNRPAES